MPSALKGFAVALSIFTFFCLMSRIDFIVHGTLYRHGLQFSYEWANEYWAIYTAIFVVFSVIIGVIYWLGSNKSVEDLKFSIALIATVNILMIGGLQDIMVYVFWAGGLPPNNVVWWWVPWNYLLGTWNSFMQIILATLTVFLTVFLWIRMLRK
ncbi:MAG: hypothetical protein ACE5KD_03695 [Candidatus Bathyarchaeia archaeon]